MQINQIINVYENNYPLYQLCKENGYTDASYDEWCEDCCDLSYFEGDPDMLKWNGETIYFGLDGDKVFYYSEAEGDEKKQIEGILRDFFASGEVKWLGYGSKYIHTKKCPENYQHWDAWDRMQAGIAYRGGYGYYYDIIPLRQTA